MTVGCDRSRVGRVETHDPTGEILDETTMALMRRASGVELSPGHLEAFLKHRPRHPLGAGRGGETARRSPGSTVLGQQSGKVEFRHALDAWVLAHRREIRLPGLGGRRSQPGSERTVTPPWRGNERTAT